jgi:formamidopyrimidine-DNA glycosylase
MFELPEIVNLSYQLNETLVGKIITSGCLGNSPHKFVWYNRKPEEFKQLVKGKKVGKSYGKGKWLFVSLEPGYILLFGECGGKILHHLPGSPLPEKYHLLLEFDDGSSLTAMTQMWGAMELYSAGEELQRQYIEDMRPTPLEPVFTNTYFSTMIDDLLKGPKRSVKSLLTQDQLIPGLGNAISQDIMFHARLHPRHSLGDLASDQRDDLFAAITTTVQAVLEKGGRNDETDLHGAQGGYIRIMDNKAVGKPCPRCGHKVEKIQYLGGACYFCPNCQV